MTAGRPGDPAQDGSDERAAGQDQPAAPPPPTRHMYDAALRRAEVGGSRALQRYSSVLLAAS